MNKKGQSSIEFTVLIGFTMLLLVSLLVVFQTNLTQAQSAQSQAQVNEYVNILKTELIFAESSPSEYYREFILPTSISSYDVNIRCENNNEIIINYKNKEYVFFFSTYLRGCENLKPGINKIRKVCSEGIFLCLPELYV